MGAALALAIMLVVVVGILSLAINAQGPFQGAGQAGGGVRRPPRNVTQTPRTAPGPAKPSRRIMKDKGDKSKDRQPSGPLPPPKEPEHSADADQLFGDLRPLHSQAHALVISVVDERTLGPVTRSRLTLRVEPVEGDAFEVTTRVAFPTPEDRARVKVGGTIPVRYDPADHRRVVVEMDKGQGD